MRFAAIVLAAGFSSRMKSFKPLLPLGETTFIDNVISSVEGAGIDETLVVVGHRREELKRHLRRTNVSIVDNPYYKQGMFTSVQAGVRRLTDDCSAFFVLPVDIPLIRPSTLKILKTAFPRADSLVLCPTFRGKRGHPPLISYLLREEIVGSGQNTSLRSLLFHHTQSSSHIEVPDRHILLDADTPEDYGRLVVRAMHWNIPTEDESESAYFIELSD
jgi:CTP:molybdopterin cytidylyltransferase MocA